MDFESIREAAKGMVSEKFQASKKIESLNAKSGVVDPYLKFALGEKLLVALKKEKLLKFFDVLEGRTLNQEDFSEILENILKKIAAELSGEESKKEEEIGKIRDLVWKNADKKWDRAQTPSSNLSDIKDKMSDMMHMMKSLTEKLGEMDKRIDDLARGRGRDDESTQKEQR